MKSEDQPRMHENPIRQSFYKRISGSGRGLGTIFTSHGTVVSRAVEGSPRKEFYRDGARTES